MFCLIQNQRIGGPKRSCLEDGEEMEKWGMKVNMVQILCTLVCKWKMVSFETIPVMEGGG
jgi:hypothetical protein